MEECGRSVSSQSRCGLSAKMLRTYAAAGLLTPAAVESSPSNSPGTTAHFADTGREDPMAPTYTEADFHELSWHDCSIWGMALHNGGGEPAFEPADLVLDIDFIVEWLCGVGAPARFRVAPAALVFHQVTDLRITVETTHSGDYRMAVSPWPILRIDRESIERPEGYPGPTSYAWTLALGTPTPGEIHFGARGFTQELRAEPVLTERQSLTIGERERRPI